MPKALNVLTEMRYPIWKVLNGNGNNTHFASPFFFAEAIGIPAKQQIKACNAN